LEKSNLRGSNFSSNSTHWIILSDFDLSLVNLGRNVKGVEERNLGGFHTSWSCWDNNVHVRDHTNLSWGSNLVGFDDFLDSVDWGLGGVGEDKTNFSLELISQNFKALVGFSVSSLELFEIFGFR